MSDPGSNAAGTDDAATCQARKRIMATDPQKIGLYPIDITGGKWTYFRISLVLFQNQYPMWCQTNKPNFIAFLTAHYQWFEEEGNALR